MKIASISEMRDMDRRAVEAYGIPELLLMENAGHAAYFVLAQALGGVERRRFTVLCGSGNNGGDGFVVARKLASNGASVTVALAGKRAKVAGISKTNLDILDRCGIPVREVRSAAEIRSDLAHSDAVIDALLGTGIRSEVRGHYREIIEAVNALSMPVMSLDIPSGIHGDTGCIMGCAVRADWTVTFGLPKLGNLLLPGGTYGGRLFVSTISFPPEMTEAPALKTAVNLPPALPARDPAGHKGSFGDVLFIAGAAAYFGAPYLCSMAMLKAGGGYARLAAPAPMVPFLAAKGTEVVYAPQEATAEGTIAESNREGLLTLAENRDMVVLGPGLSLNAETRRLVRELAASVSVPLLLDGDGITAACEDLDCIRSRTAPTVLTPHPGEMARLTGRSTAEVQGDRVGIVRVTAADLGAVVVLKGARSLIGFADGQIFVNLTGNDGMATAGSGDVLCGAIAAMVGLGMTPESAVCKGVFLHGLAGDLAADDVGRDGMSAEDLLRHLPAALSMDREGLLPESLRERYAGGACI